MTPELAPPGRPAPTPPPPGAFEGCPDPAEALDPEAVITAFIEALQAARTNGYCVIPAHAAIDPAEWERFLAPRAGGDWALLQMVSLYLSGPTDRDLPPAEFSIERADTTGDEATVLVSLQYVGAPNTVEAERALQLRRVGERWLIVTSTDSLR